MKEQFSIFMLFLMFSSSLCFEPVSPYGGSYIVSNNDFIFRIVSHSNFNRRTKYGNNKNIVWNFKMGENCCEIKFYFDFMRTSANSRCSKGDVLLARSPGRNSRYCKFRKPKKSNPLILNGDFKLIWKSDRRWKERGFECFVHSSDSCLKTTTATTQPAQTSPSKATAISCKVEGGPNNGQSCVFPFDYNGRTYDGCAFDPTRDVAPWCLNILRNRYFCSSSCPLDSTVSTALPTLVPSPLLDCACGIRRSRIVNGKESDVNEFPWMVGLSHMWTLRPFCGGVLISDRYILTAAHCCLGKLAADINVFLGDHNWMESTEAPSIRKRVLSIKIHPEYGQPVQLNHDACLIQG